MKQIRIMELENVIKNIELEMEFTDLSEAEEKANLTELKLAKKELERLQ